MGKTLVSRVLEVWRTYTSYLRFITRCGHLAHHCTALMMSQPMNSKNLMQAVVDVKDEQIAGLRRELVKKDELIKEEIAKREKLGAGGERCSDENKAEIRREREVGSREEESKVKELKRQVGAVIV